MAARKKAKPRHDISSGNVFADLGLPDAEQRLIKVKLAHQIAVLIGDAGLSQSKAAERLGIDQPKVSNLLRGRLSRGLPVSRFNYVISR